MVWVLCEVADLPALWAARGLERRGIGVEVVSAPLLAYALQWEHRVGDDNASFSIELSDGRRLCSSESVGVLNRLSAAPTAYLDAVGSPDRDYAVQELHALFLSWLYALPGPVVNRPTPNGLSGRWRHPSEWVMLSAEAGLVAIPFRQSSEDPPDASMRWGWPAQGGELEPRVTVFVAGEHVVASAPGIPDAVLDGCRRLGRLAGETLLGVDLVPWDSGWAVAGGSAVPDLSLGGEPLLDVLREVLVR